MIHGEVMGSSIPSLSRIEGGVFSGHRSRWKQVPPIGVESRITARLSVASVTGFSIPKKTRFPSNFIGIIQSYLPICSTAYQP
jgi:hypothetical protein